MVRVAHCIDDLSRAGAQLVVKLLVTHVDRGRFVPVVYAFRGGPLCEEMRAHGTAVHVLGRRWRHMDPFVVWGLARRLVRDQVDIVHAHLLGARMHAFLAAALVRRGTCVATVQNVTDGYSRRRILAERWALRRARGIVCVSDVVRQCVGALDEGLGARARVIRNAIEVPEAVDRARRGAMRRELGLGEGQTVLATVGRLHPQKGHTVLLEALRRLRRQFPQVALLIVGDGALRGELEGYCRAAELADIVHFTGERGDVPDVLSAADVFVLSSFWEGLPLALLEAMALGLPCVATRVGGVPEAIRDGYNGVLAAAGDVDGMAHALAKVIGDRAAGARLGTRARETVQAQFGAGEMARQYQQLYDEVLEAAPSEQRAAEAALPSSRRA